MVTNGLRQLARVNSYSLRLLPRIYEHQLDAYSPFTTLAFPHAFAPSDRPSCAKCPRAGWRRCRRSALADHQRRGHHAHVDQRPHQQAELVAMRVDALADILVELQRVLALAVGDAFDAAHQPGAAHLADQRQFLQRLQPRLEIRRDLARMMRECRLPAGRDSSAPPRSRSDGWCRSARGRTSHRGGSSG